MKIHRIILILFLVLVLLSGSAFADFQNQPEVNSEVCAMFSYEQLQELFPDANITAAPATLMSSRSIQELDYDCLNPNCSPTDSYVSINGADAYYLDVYSDGSYNSYGITARDSAPNGSVGISPGITYTHGGNVYYQDYTVYWNGCYGVCNMEFKTTYYYSGGKAYISKIGSQKISINANGIIGGYDTRITSYAIEEDGSNGTASAYLWGTITKTASTGQVTVPYDVTQIKLTLSFPNGQRTITGQQYLQ